MFHYANSYIFNPVTKNNLLLCPPKSLLFQNFLWIPYFMKTLMPLYIIYLKFQTNFIMLLLITSFILCNLLIFITYLFFFIVIQLQMYAFSPHPSTPPQVNPPPSPTSTLPLGFVHVSFIVVPVIPSSHCPRPPRLLLDCS